MIFLLVVTQIMLVKLQNKATTEAAKNSYLRWNIYLALTVILCALIRTFGPKVIDL